MNVNSVASQWVVYDPIYQKHLTSKGHPETPERCNAIMEGLLNAKLTDDQHILAPRPATLDDVIRCHPINYYDLVLREVAEADENGNTTLSTGDVQICPDSLEVALFAVGGVLVAVDAVMSGIAKTVFCNVRPPGHHACSDRGMGFCLFNNVAIGARYVQRIYGIERVLIVDWDVHHGNGTQDIFYDDPSVFYFSTHQTGNFYPGTGFEQETGEGLGKGMTLNMPILAGRNPREKVLRAFKNQLVPAMEQFKPQFIFISAGFDAHVRDAISGFDLTDEDFFILTGIVKEIATKHAEGRIVSVLEGGYNLEALKTAVAAHVQALH